MLQVFIFGVPCQFFLEKRGEKTTKTAGTFFQVPKKPRFFTGSIDSKKFGSVFLGDFVGLFGLSPFPVIVTTRIITFLVGNPNLNLHFHYYWEGGQPKGCFSYHGKPFQPNHRVFH